MKKSVFLIPISILLSLVIGFFCLTSSEKMLIAPMIGGLDACMFKAKVLLNDSPNSQYTTLCAKDHESPSFLIKKTLDRLSESAENGVGYRLGYTLNIPLLSLFVEKNGGYFIDEGLVSRVVKTVENTNKPVVLYLYSNHFGINAPIEKRMALDSKNLLNSKNGVMSIDKYYNVDIYPWSFVEFNNPITKLREAAFAAVLDELCKLPARVLDRVEGVTILGELHHMFPDFQAGMGFEKDYLTSDFGQVSVLGFRKYLAQTYGDVRKLNYYLESNFSSFDQINPPKNDIRHVSLSNFWEHSDAYAHGILPISGWVARKLSNRDEKNWIQIFDNGKYLGRVSANQGRQDVLSVYPQIDSVDVGWKFDYPFHSVQYGFHQIDVFLENAPGDPLTHLASRKITIMKKSQEPPHILPIVPLPLSVSSDVSLLFNVDHPRDLSSFYFNPLAVLWNEYRRSQVKSYLGHFGAIAKSKCINPELIYSHQILPFVNPGWDESKFAVGRDLAVPSDMTLGISLYGDATYGKSFFDWYKTTHRSKYGVTEFHPLKPMNARELDAVFASHAKNNAKFISFFVESIGLDEDPTNKPNIFSFDPNNANAGSNVLFSSVRRILN